MAAPRDFAGALCVYEKRFCSAGRVWERRLKSTYIDTHRHSPPIHMHARRVFPPRGVPALHRRTRFPPLGRSGSWCPAGRWVACSFSGTIGRVLALAKPELFARIGPRPVREVFKRKNFLLELAFNNLGEGFPGLLELVQRLAGAFLDGDVLKVLKAMIPFNVP